VDRAVAVWWAGWVGNAGSLASSDTISEDQTGESNHHKICCSVGAAWIVHYQSSHMIPWRYMRSFRSFRKTTRQFARL
jgi:hypothetical protein